MRIQLSEYLMFSISAQLISYTHPKHAISDYLYWKNNLCTIMQHNLICEYNDSNIFLDSHIPLSIYNKFTPHSP